MIKNKSQKQIPGMVSINFFSSFSNLSIVTAAPTINPLTHFFIMFNSVTFVGCTNTGYWQSLNFTSTPNFR